MRYLYIVSSLLLLLVACTKEEIDLRLPYEVPFIDPTTQPNLLSQNLILSGTMAPGDMPAPTTDNAPEITNAQTSGSATNGSALYIPFTFNPIPDLAGIYLQITGADHHWVIPVSAPPGTETLVYDLEIPGFVLVGNFELSYALFDANGQVSEPKQMNIAVTALANACDQGGRYHESGTAGLTVRRIELGNQPGTVSIEYEMYSLPDRLDIRYNDQWVASTSATLLGPNETPPPSIECYDGTEGYVSGDAVLTFEYDPAVSREFFIYMYGCFGSTLWDFWVDCPESGEAGCGDTPDPGLLQPRLKGFQILGNTPGKLKTPIYLNEGDFVFLSFEGEAGLFIEQEPGESPTLEDIDPLGMEELPERRTYAGFNTGQLILHVPGYPPLPAAEFSLKGQDCPGVADEFFTREVVFRGEYGDYLVAKTSGFLEVELNDQAPEKNTGGFVGDIYVLSKADHENRNCFNKCPKLRPKMVPQDMYQYKDSAGEHWESMTFTGLGLGYDFGLDKDLEACYHGGEKAQDEFRGDEADLQGCQCVYKKIERTIVNGPNDNEMGTFDYGYFADPNNKRLHFILDVFPHIAYPVAGQTFAYIPTENLYE